MKSQLALALLAFSSVMAQNNGQAAQEVVDCMSRCNQESSTWVNCAAECMGVPHPTTKDDMFHLLALARNTYSCNSRSITVVQDTRDCFNECGQADGGCQSNCIKTHFVEDGNTKEGSKTTNTSISSTGANVSTTTTSNQSSTSLNKLSSTAMPTGVVKSTANTLSSGAALKKIIIASVGLLLSGLVRMQY
ncbi:hypothetical protein K493DRAFT_298704 [Basidiobolus meristosporus CBS 931.73]|uniref:Uncharacterized protein n=1 Tax=Basidiobolus meristosporus CBS 931.73 TaxID=1314790 RepID=A0A1Y1YRW7_9FUNG|nr:hypothetical protein K493DRAFT_298704 [Basidiobolus meristosporus CBS 931.73]|eukprot:ORY00780.1 hypothetical protein K493DRAFT_298704 [Basidiobolus meristosporus CBS 931.73]